MLDEHQKQFLKFYKDLSVRHSNPLEDFAEMAAISFANVLPVQDAAWKEREKRYEEIMKHYEPKEREIFPKLLGCLSESLTVNDGKDFRFHDAAGEMCMTDEIHKWAGDVAFTPFHVSFMMAKMTLDTGLLDSVKSGKKKFFTLGEPACGTGGMVIAAAAALHEEKINFQQVMHVTAVDIRAAFAHLTYVQLSLLHIPAIVVHGDSLALKSWSTWTTLAHHMGFWDGKLARERAEQPVSIPKPVPNKKGQFGLFRESA